MRKGSRQIKHPVQRSLFFQREFPYDRIGEEGESQIIPDAGERPAEKQEGELHDQEEKEGLGRRLIPILYLIQRGEQQRINDRDGQGREELKDPRPGNQIKIQIDNDVRCINGLRQGPTQPILAHLLQQLIIKCQVVVLIRFGEKGDDGQREDEAERQGIQLCGLDAHVLARGDNIDEDKSGHVDR